MHYARFYGCDLVNGEGIRVTLFVSGCLHACAGCYNRSTWDRKSGQPFTAEVEAELLDLCASHDGLSLSGGDPLHPHNRAAIESLCRAFKARYPDKDIWLWTGYRYEDIGTLALLRYIDVLIDGKYEQDLPTTKPWRGSDNQRLFRLAQQPAPACA
ncbi:anaerobic ribonucleoside-triphosphate reductase activating protein [Craterilacuibacter sinensis]|uniref:Anaerobic ribonucleoside-triphosphate reductase-activating protein n=1 Tax=Craterilacuibacter sinensis TaxID=2686017 RepID=A0A845BPF5_9NEIS|nr:anaerobic ribonucleoside-triphosphate reductase activating protein [Craterilacuibacter sinensis]MXR36156.1 anaerobic ribonucleoside-triphosphate reductase activating protein [Craterilacuibacter sinensis]